jgi:NitT/TauT family transport system ATP-binding protein
VVTRSRGGRSDCAARALAISGDAPRRRTLGAPQRSRLADGPTAAVAIGASAAIEQVSKEFDARGKRVLALEAVDLTVTEGEFVTIVGPSGCGKSTLLNLIVGLVRPSVGRILFRGRAVAGITPAIGYVTQRDNLLPWRTLAENVGSALELRGMPADERRRRAGALIEQVGLQGFEDHYPHELSGGMRQRANIARTLLLDPALVLMDEPFGPLDAQTRLLLQQQLLTLWAGS